MEEELKRFVAGLREKFDSDLVSVVLYGSAARGAHVAGASDVNLIVVLREVGLDGLSAAAELVARVRRERFRPVFWTEGELRRSADVFPVEYRDILAGYKVLHGADLFAGVVVDGRNLRHQLEFELRSKLMRLRSAWFSMKGDKAGLEGALKEAGPSFARLLDETRGLPGIRLPEDASRAFEECRRLKRGEIRPGLDGLEKLYGEVHESVEALVAAVDELG
jgi:predicted nucleotidyltransferase